MAADEKAGVTRPDGQHWQLENLSIHDGSIFPTSIGANPQLSIYGTVNRRPWRSGCWGHWSMNSGRTSSTALVSGSQSDDGAHQRRQLCHAGRTRPLKNIMGVSTSVK
jgi:hypothetical protein